jgi:hypothetical protein
VHLTLEREPAILGPPAAVYAETGHYDKAIELEWRATELATQPRKPTLAQRLNARLALNEEKTPIRR